MKKQVLILAVIWNLLAASSCFASQSQWQQLSSVPVRPVKAVLVWKDEPNKILAGTNNAIYKSEDRAKSWKLVLTLSGAGNSINNLVFGDKDKKRVWAATSNGLYCSIDKGASWKRVFKGRDYLERQCCAVLSLADKVLLGTSSGLFESRDLGRIWQKSSAVKSNSNIIAIVNSEADPKIVYMVNTEGIFRSNDSANNWEKVYVAINKEIAPVPEEEPDEGAGVCQPQGVRYLAVAPGNQQYLAAATSAGVIISRDAGATWDHLTDYGLLEKNVYNLIFLPDNCLYALIRSGAFEYREDRWRELTLELATTKIYAIDFDKSGNIYAACEEGLFKHVLKFQEQDQEKPAHDVSFNNEPKIEDVQNAAIKYAEVQPEKIKLWRKAAAEKALLPKISTSVGNNITDLWHWETGSSTKCGDDVLMKGNAAIEWDVSMSWDLGELIWNEAQTSIDARSRLMVELRNDILDEVTKIYFERQRALIELENLPTEDRRKRLDKEIKVKELTANLDALTGGYFSRPANLRR